MASLYKRTGSEVWQARIKVGDELRRISTGERVKRRAQEEADRREREANANLIDPRDVRLVAAAARYFSEKSQLQPKTVIEYKHALANVFEVLGDFPLKALTEKHLHTYIDGKLDKPVQLRRDLAFLSSLYTLARLWEHGPRTNPIKAFDKSGIPEAKKHQTWLRPAEFDRLLSACRTELHRRFVILAVQTGMRYRELLNLRWEEVDLQEGVIELKGERTKNRTGRIIPLSQLARDTFFDTPEAQRVGCVFPNQKGDEPLTNIHKAWIGIRTRAGLPKLRIHDLRHTFASWAKQRGIPETTIMEIMGHKTRSMVSRYSHDSVDTLRSAIKAFDRDTVRDTGAPDDLRHSA
ncbi:tyrosine-type recombinase/integrase [Faunimonas sp. B44]|uniref:tyrosine-type recombinase/integrase n=1 Tax=Faunimonas sp. B44 TaxID=3461493 RepID=UPI004043D892